LKKYFETTPPFPISGNFLKRDSQGCVLKAAFCLAFIILLVLQCSEKNDDNDGLKLVGNSSGVGNGMVVGKLYGPQGKNPSQGTIVSVWRKNTVATFNDTSLSGALKTTATNMAGVFAIDTIDTGMYIIQGIDNDENMVFIDSVHIAKPDTTIKLPPDTLKEPGAIKGSVNLPLGGSFRQVFVLAFGTDRYTQVNEDGTFLFKQLAEATYTFKILSVSSLYGAIDSGNIRVISAETTDIGTLDLPLRQMPKLKLQTAYDSMRQVVTLSWCRRRSGGTPVKE
jgi:hypothetical protein